MPINRKKCVTRAAAGPGMFGTPSKVKAWKATCPEEAMIHTLLYQSRKNIPLIATACFLVNGSGAATTIPAGYTRAASKEAVALRVRIGCKSML